MSLLAGQRRLSFPGLVAATFFIVSGGPYGLEEVISGRGYAGAVWLVAVLPLAWSLPVALCVGELASALPATGGYYVWVRRALGPFWGLQAAWLFLSVTIVDLAIYPAMFVAYLSRQWPGLGGVEAGGLGWGLAVAVIATGAAWNLLGIRAVGRGSEAVGILVLAPFVLMVALAAWALPSGGAARLGTALGQASPSDASGLAAALLIAMWNYMGWDNTSTFAGEVDDPRRNYPRAMFAGLVLVTLSYLLPVLAAASSGMSPASWTTGSWVDAAARVGGGWLAALAVAGGAATAIAMFVAILLYWSRLPVALAEDGWMPASIGRRSARTGSPVVSVVLGALACAAVVGLGLRRLVEIDVLLYGAGLTLELVSLVVLRLREPDLPRPYRIPGGLPVVAAVAALPVALLAFAAWQGRNEPGALGVPAAGIALLVASAGPVWYAARFRAVRTSRL
ncbi:MAG TPA: APC family permease [Anaeromyxobacteraceae bacterium]|nr:APC family permease [Anaeromyxobacteraceae bacterium]